jgi:hypothetical protein
MLADRNVKLLGLVALADAANAVVGMQAVDPCLAWRAFRA